MSKKKSIRLEDILVELVDYKDLEPIIPKQHIRFTFGKSDYHPLTMRVVKKLEKLGYVVFHMFTRYLCYAYAVEWKVSKQEALNAIIRRFNYFNDFSVSPHGDYDSYSWDADMKAYRKYFLDK